MSDKVAEEKEKEEAEAKKKAEEAQKKLWVIQIVRDPDTGNTFVQPGQNVTKQWQLDLMLAQATRSIEMTRQAKIIGELFVNILKGAGMIKEKKSFFKGR